MRSFYIALATLLFFTGCAVKPIPPRPVPPPGVAKRSVRVVLGPKSIEMNGAARDEFLSALDRELHGTGKSYLNAFKRGNNFTVRCEITKYLPYGGRVSDTGAFEYEDELQVSVKVFDARGKLRWDGSCGGYGHHPRGLIVISSEPTDSSAPANAAESVAGAAVEAAYGRDVARSRD